LRAHTVAHLDLAGTPAARDLEAHHGLAVEEGGGGGFGHGVAHLGDLVQADAAAIGERDLHARQRLGRGELRQACAAAAGCHPGPHGRPRSRSARLRQLARDVGGGGAQGLQLERVEQHLHLAVHAADAADGAHAGHGQQPLGHVVIDEPGEGLGVHLVGGHGVGQHRAAGQFHLADDGVAQVGGQLAAHLGHGRAHVVQRLLRVLLDAELGRERDRAVLHLGVDVLQALQRGQAVLDDAGDVVFELVGRGARQRRHHGDGGQIQVGEVLHLHLLEGEQARQREHDEQHRRRDGVLDGPGGDVHGRALTERP
jgi:hypothetical protein